MEAFCSLYLIEREINDPLRRAAAAKAAVSKYKDMKSCWDGDVSKGISAEGYEILSPDPLENSKMIYVDVKVSILDVINSESEKVTRTLNNLDQIKDENIRFITREVDVDECYDEFYRRISLFNLAKLISDTYKDNKEDIVDALFEPPAAITEENNLMSLTNRSRFTKEALQDWFFDLDTYSKCITLVETFSCNLHLVDAPVRLDIYDIYCKTYTRINRLVHLNMIDKSDIKTQFRELSILEDVKATPVNNVLTNFLSFTPDVHNKIMFERDENVASFHDFFKTIKEKDLQQPIKKRLKTIHDEIKTYTIKNGYSLCGASIEPFSISVRKEAILPSVNRKQLLFPVYSSSGPDDDVLFFVKPKKTTITTLFLPGLFRSRGQFLSGDCRDLMTTDTSQWRYTLADYTPIREEKKNKVDFYASSKGGSSKIPVLQPLCF